MWHPPHLVRLTGCLVLFVAMTTTATASAQNPTADAAFKRGRALMKAGKYREACEALEESQRLDPQLTTLFELGGCHEKIGKIATAWNDFREIATRDTDKRRRKKATEMVARLAPRVSKLLVQVDHDLPGLAVTLSGRDITDQVGVDIPVDPGTYAVTATATGFKDTNRDVKVGADGKVVTLQLVLEPIGGTSDKLPDKAPDGDIKPPPDVHPDKHVDPQPPPIEQPQPAPPTSRRKTYAVLSTAVGVAAAGGMIYYGIQARSDRDTAHRQCPDPCHDSDPNAPTAKQTIANARHEGNIATVLGVTSLVFVGAGAYLWFTAPDVTIAPAVTASGAGVSVSGRF
jgi:hypothetical protein